MTLTDVILKNMKKTKLKKNGVEFPLKQLSLKNGYNSQKIKGTASNTELNMGFWTDDWNAPIMFVLFTTLKNIVIVYIQ